MKPRNIKDKTTLFNTTQGIKERKEAQMPPKQNLILPLFWVHLKGETPLLATYPVSLDDIRAWLSTTKSMDSKKFRGMG